MLYSEVLFCLVFTGLQTFVVLRLLDRETTWWNVSSFSLLQASSIILFAHIVPSTGWQFLCTSVTFAVFFTWVFNADLFPDGLAVYLTSLAFAAIGELVFQPVLRIHTFPFPRSNVAIKALGTPLSLGAYIPIVLMATFFVIRDRFVNDSESYRRWNLDANSWLTICGLIAIVSYLKSIVSHSLYTHMFLGACVFAMPVTFYTLHKYKARDEQTEKSLQYLIKQRAIQKSAIKVLREERHELINELTLISTYLQMGKIHEAMTCIDYSSAKLADRNNYASLPHDAWLTVLEHKQKEAEHRNIAFTVNVEAEAPHCFEEQRLLPKLIINLVDNAFNAVSGRDDPQVTLTWSSNSTGERTLIVSNNGPEISAWDGKMMFRGGMTTRKDRTENHGWGLVICQDIARELMGTLTYTTSPEQTCFILTLPAMTVESYGQRLAT